MRLTLVIYSMGCGGAERVLATMANHWAEAGRDVTLLTLTDGDVPDFYEIHPAVRRVRLGIVGVSPGPIRGLVNNLGRIAALRRGIRGTDPGAVISFMSRTNVLVLLACVGMRVPVIVSERCDPSRLGIGRAWRVLRRSLYPLASSVVVQTESLRAYFGPDVSRRARVIPNAVGPVAKIEGDGEGRGRRVVVSAGRLDPQKGFDLLIRAFATIAPDHPDWTLVIWGEGPSRADLEALRDRLGLEGRVHLPGVTKSLGSEFLASGLYVLSSRYEGFPNVLCEAMARGLPVVSFDCPSGPREIIRDGEDGVLVPPEDVSALAKALGRLMGDEGGRRRLSVRAPEVVERFSIGRVMDLWDEAIRASAGRRRLA